MRVVVRVMVVMPVLAVAMRVVAALVTISYFN